MADQQENIDQIDSSELFESAIGNEPAQEAEPVAAQVTEQPRDEGGRFAAKSEEQPAPAQAEPDAKDEANVPSWRLREINEERKSALAERDNYQRELAGYRSRFEALEKQLQQNAPKPEPVDIFANPDAWAQQQLSPIEQRMQSLTMNLTLRASRAENVAVHGRDSVNAAEKAVEEAMRAGDPEIAGLRAKMIASDDPVGVAVDWHKSRSVWKETGGDLAAYRQKILDEAMKDPAMQAKFIEAARGQATGTQPKNITRLPPSLNKVAASAGNDAADNDVSDGALFAHAMR